jgi:hypothetical protein
MLMTGLFVLAAGAMMFPPPSYGRDVTCQMPYKKLLCRLENGQNASAVNCFRNGQSFASFQCTREGPVWKCVTKDGPGGAVRQLSNEDFQKDVARCDRLCEFCVYDWQTVREEPKTDHPAKDREGKKCRIISKCVQEGEVEVTKVRQKCTTSTFSDTTNCENEPYQAKVRKCLLYEDKEVCE